MSASRPGASVPTSSAIPWVSAGSIVYLARYRSDALVVVWAEAVVAERIRLALD